MAVEVKAGRISECLIALDKIVTASDDAKNNIPFEASYWALRMSKKLKTEEESFMKQRDALLKKYGEQVLDEKSGMFNGQYKFITKELAETFNKEIIELAETEITIEGISTKPMSVFGEKFQGIYSSLKVLLDVLIIDDVKEVIEEAQIVN